MVEKKKDKIPEISDIPGIGPTTEEKLKNHGYSEVINLSVAVPRTVSEITGMSEVACRKIIQCAREMMHMDFKNGKDVDKKQEEDTKYLSFGCKPLDDLTKGLRTGWITEAYGAWGSSKTQIAFQLCVTAQLPEDKGGFGDDAKIVYVDTENTFVTSRIRQIAKAKGLDPEKVLSNILYIRVFNSDHQIFAAQEINKLLQKKENIKLIIVDSLTAHFRSDFSGRGELYDRQSSLNRHMRYLANLSTQYDLVVFVTNQVMSNPAGIYGDPTVAVGGNILGHNSTTRLYLRRAAKGTRVAKLVDSPNLADGECTYIVTNDGLEEA